MVVGVERTTKELELAAAACLVASSSFSCSDATFVLLQHCIIQRQTWQNKLWLHSSLILVLVLCCVSKQSSSNRHYLAGCPVITLLLFGAADVIQLLLSTQQRTGSDVRRKPSETHHSVTSRRLRSTPGSLSLSSLCPLHVPSLYCLDDPLSDSLQLHLPPFAHSASASTTQLLNSSPSTRGPSPLCSRHLSRVLVNFHPLHASSQLSLSLPPSQLSSSAHN